MQREVIKVRTEEEYQRLYDYRIEPIIKERQLQLSHYLFLNHPHIWKQIPSNEMKLMAIQEVMNEEEIPIILVDPTVEPFKFKEEELHDKVNVGEVFNKHSMITGILNYEMSLGLTKEEACVPSSIRVHEEIYKKEKRMEEQKAREQAEEEDLKNRREHLHKFVKEAKEQNLTGDDFANYVKNKYYELFPKE